MHGDTQAKEPFTIPKWAHGVIPVSVLTRLRGAGVVDDLLREEYLGAVGGRRAGRGGQFSAVPHVLEQEDQPVHRPGNASVC